MGQSFGRYAIGADSEIAAALAKLSKYLKGANLEFADTQAKSTIKSEGIVTEGERSRTPPQDSGLPDFTSPVATPGSARSSPADGASI